MRPKTNGVVRHLPLPSPAIEPPASARPEIDALRVFVRHLAHGQAIDDYRRREAQGEQS
jgi:hypothetical protein